MPKLVHDSWAWWRTYLSPRGPDGIMRLVLGWLVLAPPGEARHPGEVWASVPDDVPIDPRYTTMPVLPDRTPCPTAPDLSPDNFLTLTLEEKYVSGQNSEQASDELSALARNREPCLRTWLATAEMAKRYRGYSDSLGRLTPAGLRFKGYQQVINEVVASTRGDRSGDDTSRLGGTPGANNARFDGNAADEHLAEQPPDSSASPGRTGRVLRRAEGDNYCGRRMPFAQIPLPTFLTQWRTSSPVEDRGSAT
ncbi:MAG: hypothetical protein JW395_2714 [Nitrospira sp.]|nr:hypothetical protein [Nitrospira sp.]